MQLWDHPALLSQGHDLGRFRPGFVMTLERGGLPTRSKRSATLGWKALS